MRARRYAPRSVRDARGYAPCFDVLWMPLAASRHAENAIMRRVIFAMLMFTFTAVTP